ncbi:MAG: hypothetical protein IIY06_03355 [Proteobacteria bacterium]|nr:hypothetical protein [Pseudomonadota bacterium]
MKIIIHRGTHQIGGCATEIATQNTRIIIDMGEELSLDQTFVSAPLDIPGVTDNDGHCDAVLFTHYHGDHTGQLSLLHSRNTPIYLGKLTQKILRRTTEHAIQNYENYFVRQPDEYGIRANKNARDQQSLVFLETARTFATATPLTIGDFRITPFVSDHSAIDSYMFLIEAEGKRVLHTGDFRLSGFSSAMLIQTLRNCIGHVDVVITEGTTLYDAMHPKDEDCYDPAFLPAPQAETTHLDKPMTEKELQDIVINLQEEYQYIFIMMPSTALDRVCAIAKTKPQGGYFVIDSYQKSLLDIVEEHYPPQDTFHRDFKAFVINRTVLNNNEFMEKMRNAKIVAAVRNTSLFNRFIQTICNTEERKKKSIFLYAMWDGYRRAYGNTINDFLALGGTWAQLHTSGHATPEAIKTLLDITTPDVVIPIHTEHPEMLKTYYPEKSTIILNDKEVFTL